MTSVGVRIAQGATVALLSSVIGAIGTQAAQAAGGCPTNGGAGTKARVLTGIELGRACFSFGDKRLRANDTHVDGASIYGVLDYSSNYAQQWDANGANTGWEVSAQPPVGAVPSVVLITCAYDRDGASGVANWGCSTKKLIYRSVAT